MSGKTNLKNVLAATIPSMVSGIKKHFAGKSLVLNTVTMTADELIALLYTVPTQVEAAAAAQTVAKAKVAAADAAAANVAPVMSSLHSVIRGQFGASNVAVEDFGMTPSRRGKRTVASKVEAVAKSLATRAERRTMGKRQKAKVRGTAPASTKSGT